MNEGVKMIQYQIFFCFYFKLTIRCSYIGRICLISNRNSITIRLRDRRAGKIITFLSCFFVDTGLRGIFFFLSLLCASLFLLLLFQSRRKFFQCLKYRFSSNHPPSHFSNKVESCYWTNVTFLNEVSIHLVNILREGFLKLDRLTHILCFLFRNFNSNWQDLEIYPQPIDSVFH